MPWGDHIWPAGWSNRSQPAGREGIRQMRPWRGARGSELPALQTTFLHPRLTSCPWFLRDFPVFFQLSVFFFFPHVLGFLLYTSRTPSTRSGDTVTEGSLVNLFGFRFSRYSKKLTWESPSTFYGQKKARHLASPPGLPGREAVFDPDPASPPPCLLDLGKPCLLDLEVSSRKRNTGSKA